MKIFSFFAALWMGVLAAFGLGGHPTQPITPSSTPPVYVPMDGGVASSSAGVVSSTVTPQNPTTTSTSVKSTTPTGNTVVTTDDLPRTGSVLPYSLPLGDGKYTTTAPASGYIYLCHVQSGGEGAQGNPTWIAGSQWYPSEKVAVKGSVAWSNASYSMSVNGSTRLIVSNGLPTDHNTGIFPIQASDPAYQFDANPNSIKEQNYSFSLPASPTALAKPQCIYGQVGIMNDGVPLFDGFDAEYRDAVARETQDVWEGHPNESGVYHYHGFEGSYLESSVSTVVGFAFDGFPITGGKFSNGTYLTTSQLDECHGITSPIILNGQSVTMYHYVLTPDFPYSVSCFRGTSYEPKPGVGGGSAASAGAMGASASSSLNNGAASPTPPAAAISACSTVKSGTSCSFSGGPNGTVTGTCMAPPGQTTLACVPGK